MRCESTDDHPKARAGDASTPEHGRNIHPAEPVLRFYEAIAARDFEAAGPCFAETARWCFPGRNCLSGTYVGWSDIRDRFLTQLIRRSGGTLRLDLLDVAVGKEFVVAVQHGTADCEGRKLDVTACQLMKVAGGVIEEVVGHYSDQEALDRFWG